MTVASHTCNAMITLFIEDYNNFSQEIYDELVAKIQIHLLECPSCRQSACCTIHGYYSRNYILQGKSTPLRICRVKCKCCGHTHALIPSFLVPYCQSPVSDQHEIVTSFEEGKSSAEICDENPSIDENTVKSVVRRYKRFWKERLHAEAISLKVLDSLIISCFAFYSMQFMQIRNTTNQLFLNTT